MVTTTVERSLKAFFCSEVSVYCDGYTEQHSLRGHTSQSMKDLGNINELWL